MKTGQFSTIEMINQWPPSPNVALYSESQYEREPCLLVFVPNHVISGLQLFRSMTASSRPIGARSSAQSGKAGQSAMSGICACKFIEKRHRHRAKNGASIRSTAATDAIRMK
jgi:hypothetical protein